MKNVVLFRFHLSLNDFLFHSKKNQFIEYSFNGNPSVKDDIEAIGIPHVEVDVILQNNHPIPFTANISNKDIVEVYPSKHQLELPENYTLRSSFPLQFILDVHLGGLARKLRLLGFDTYYETNYSDHFIAQTALTEQRIVLTRDIGLLKHKSIEWGYWLRSQHTKEQLREVMQRYQLYQLIQPFRRCLSCNGSIAPVEKIAIAHQLPQNIYDAFPDFYQCGNCKKIYWKGSHYDRMIGFIESIKKSEMQS